jgi:hypothetical protein
LEWIGLGGSCCDEVHSQGLGLGLGFLNQATFQDKNTKSETIDHEHEKIRKLNEYQRQCAEQLEEGQDSPDMQEYLRQKIKQLKAKRKALISAQRLAFN